MKPTPRHKRIAARLRLVDPRCRALTAERVRAIDQDQDWQRSHPVDYMVLAALDGRKERVKPPCASTAP